MLRTALWAILTLAFTGGFARAQNGRPDPAFDRVPFHDWFTQTDQTRIHWSADVAPVTLSPHQRLTSHVRFLIDGAELSRRMGKGQFMMFVELEDDEHRLWRDHEAINLERPDFHFEGATLQFLDDFFVRPGNYRGAFAIYDTATGEHSVLRRTFHANALHGDPFAAAWNNLPAIEFLRIPPPPDSWYLPGVRSRVAITAKAASPTTLDLILNLTPSERLSGSTSAQNRSLSVLLPSLKVLAQIDWQNVRMNVSLVDLARQRVTFEQAFAPDSGVRRVNWRALRNSLESTNPGMIDVHALEGQERQADFFVNTVQKKIESGKGTRAVVILSGPVGFEHGQEMHPIAAPQDPGLRMYYIRYLPRVPYTVQELQWMNIPEHHPMREVASLVDQLEPLLKPIGPRLFDVATPDEFRRAMAVIVADLEKSQRD